MDLVEVALVHVGGEEDVDGLALADEGGAVGGVFDDPALVEFEGGFEDGFFIVGQEVEVLDRAFGDGDVGPGGVVVAAFGGQELLKVAVADGEAAGEGFLEEDVGGDGFDAGAGVAGNDGDGGGGGDCHFIGEAFHEAVIGRVGAGAAFLGEGFRCEVGAGADVFEDFDVPGFCHRGFEGDVQGL